MVGFMRRAAAAVGMIGAALAVFEVTALCLATPAYAEVTAGQTGSGQSSLVLRLQSSGESGGTAAEGDLVNPDLDGDGLGDNLAFTVPTRIDFTVMPDGTLVGPSPELVYIENESVYSVHVSSLRVSPLNGWNIVSDATNSTERNCVDLTAGPTGDALSIASYLSKSAVMNPAEWNMASRTSADVSDRVQLSFAGHVGNVSQDVTREIAFGQIEWFVTPGKAA